MIKIRYSKKINSKKLENFSIKKGFKNVVELSKEKDLSANAKFLKDNLMRNWVYKNDFGKDQHIFLLNEPILGKYNFLQNKFYKKFS